MALKIWLNNSMQKIDTSLHKPVIFINGAKKVLEKAYTFVNGEKYEIWGASGVQVDYISSTGTLGGGNVFAIGENWANVSYNNNILRLDISNLSSPSLIQSIAGGNVASFNADYQSTQENSIMGSFNTSSNTAYKLLINNTDGTIVVDSSSVINASSSYTNSRYLFGLTNSSIVCCIREILSLQPTVRYTQRIFWDGTQKYSMTMAGRTYTGLMQIADNSVLGINSIGNSVESFTESGRSEVGTIQYGANTSVYDDGYIYCASTSNANGNFITKRASNNISTVLYTYPASAVSNEVYRILGIIGNYIYCLKTPFSNATAGSEVRLVLLNKSDLTVAVEKILPNDPFNENNGVPTFWTSCTMKPQFSRTGFLGVSTYNSSTLSLRIARFSGLI